MGDQTRLRCIYITLCNLQLIKHNKWEMIDSLGYQEVEDIIKLHVEAFETCSRITYLDQQACNELIEDLLTFQQNFN